jgi:hypothetical protein
MAARGRIKVLRFRVPALPDEIAGMASSAKNIFRAAGVHLFQRRVPELG